MNKKGIYYTSASAVLFGVTPLFTMLACTLGATSITVVFYRSLLVIGMLGIILCFQKISFRVQSGQLIKIAFVSLFGSGLTTILLVQSYQLIDTGTATSLHFLYPIFVALLCRIVYKEKLTRRKCISLALALLGMSMFLLQSGNQSFFGFFLAFASSITYAFYMVYLEKSGLAHMNPYILSFYISAFVTLETLAYHTLSPTIVWALPPLAFLYLFFVGICSSFLGVIWLQKGILYLGSSTASLFCLFEPITSLLVGVLFLNETLSIFKIIGCICILIALTLLVISDRKGVENNIEKEDNALSNES